MSECRDRRNMFVGRSLWKIKDKCRLSRKWLATDLNCSYSVNVMLAAPSVEPNRLNLTLDYTQGCTVGVPDAWCEEVNANRADVQTDRRKHRRHSLL
jgi:hypothetical protein